MSVAQEIQELLQRKDWIDQNIGEVKYFELAWLLDAVGLLLKLELERQQEVQ